MTEPIKWLNYFTGQFLEEPDFKAEQQYHERMRRMLTYATFTPGILNGLAVSKIDGGRALVQKGVAIDALENSPEGDQESRAIMITEDRIINLRSGPDGHGFSDGDDVFLYVTYRKTPTDGDVPKNTRFQLREEVLTIKDTGSGFSLNTNLNILLGKAALSGGDLTVLPPDSTNRIQASLRLSGASTGPDDATLVSINVQPPSITLNEDDTQPFQAAGSFDDATTQPLTPADGLAWSSSAPGTVSINATTGQASALNAGGPVTITATVGTITGTATVQVQPVAIPPVINFLAPDRQISNGTIDVHGTNIRDAGTTPDIHFVKGASSKAGLNPVVRPDVAGRQVIRVTVPDRSGTLWGPKENVSLELTFSGLIATRPFRYDD